MFVHLRTHSDYSLMESNLKIATLVKRAKELNMKALALTDHNSMAGWVELAFHCRKAGIKPVFGAEIDVASQDGSYLLPLLATNHGGYLNLINLIQLDKPVSKEDVRRFSKGLIGLSGGVQGEIADLLLRGEYSQATEVNRDYEEIFSPANWYLEISVKSQSEQELAELLRTHFPKANMVAVQPVYHLSSADKPVLQALSGIKNGMSYPEVSLEDRSFLTADQMRELCQEHPQLVDNTTLIANRCQVTLPTCHELPQPPESRSLDEMVWAGAKKRYPAMNLLVKQRITHELAVISELKFTSYFLIVADLVGFAKSQGISVGPGRGSAGGSVVAYCLGITEICPIKYGLVFERFLNYFRQGLPDIDLDFCYLRRSELFSYLMERYGKDRVGHIGTYGTFGIRLAIRELGKVFSLSKQTVDQLLRGLPEDNRQALVVLEKRLKQKPGFFQLIEGLVGVNRHFSTHAAGVVLSPKPLSHFCAVESQRDNMGVTQLNMESLADLGLVKFDLLGLRTLTILATVEKQVHDSNPEFSWGKVSLDDNATYQLLSQGRSLGIFQLESSMFQDLLKQFQPEKFSELIALLALGRPGPLSYVPTYLKRREGSEVVEYPHPVVEPILKETYGLMIYQEQVMQLAHQLGGLSLAEADTLRISMSKKDAKQLTSLKERFVSGAKNHGLTKEEGEKLFAEMERFAGYAFNKAHSSCYALISFRCAYLKAHYPTSFYLALLDSLPHNKLEQLFIDILEEDIPLLPPDVRFSQPGFSREGTGIRLGLAHLKGMGQASAESVTNPRKAAQFKDIEDFLRRVKPSQQMLASLIYGGALDCFGKRPHLSQAYLEKPRVFPSELEWMRMEKDIVGMYFSDHPTRRWLPFLSRLQPGFSPMLCGEVGELRTIKGGLRGQLNTAKRSFSFSLMRGGSPLSTGDLVAFFGEVANHHIQVSLVLPLRPMLLVQAKESQFPQVKELLSGNQGKHPVLLYLGHQAMQILPQQFWVQPKEELTEGLLKESIRFKWVDPWRELPEKIRGIFWDSPE